MILPQPLRTPLVATAIVVGGLLVLAIPLHQLTTAKAAALRPAPPPQQANHTPAWLTLKLLTPADAITLATTDGTILWSLGPSAAGDHETHLELPVTDGHTELVLDVQRPDHAPESAAFLTIAPDGMNERQAHALGSGTIRELLNFDW